MAKSSLLAADSKFYGDSLESLLRVDLQGSRTLGAFDTAKISMAIQDATAKLAHILKEPTEERTQSRKTDRQEALLIPRAQLGRSMFFGFPPAPESIDLSLLPELAIRSWSEMAALELCSILPSSREDDGALDALTSQRATVRSAVSDIVHAVTDIATGIGLDFTVAGHEPVHSEMTVDQAEVLADTFKERRTDRRIEQVPGQLDGLRTRRRIFYLELGSGEELHGAIGPDPLLMEQIKENLGRSVVATLESERVETLDGRRGRLKYRLVALEPRVGLFD